MAGTICGQCGGGAARHLVARDQNRRVTDEVFTYYRCGSCGVVFVDPMPRDLGRFYPAGYHRIPASADELAPNEKHERFKLDAIGVTGGGRSLLEIGPSYGGFSRIAQRAGYRVTALEMDEACCRFLNEAIGIDARHTTDVAGDLKALGGFDVITLWHSIEHLPDPWSMLDALPAHLDDGGTLAIATPNPLALQFRVFGAHWVHLDAPRHVVFIPPAVLDARLARHGLRRTHFTTLDQGAQDCNLLSWQESPRLKFPEWMRGPLFRRIGRTLLARLQRREMQDPNGSAYTAVYRKG